MRLTAFTDYSLRVLIYLASRPSQRATIAEIASAFGVSENHLTKVVHFLGKSGWLTTVRGKGGGLVLATPPDRIGVGDVVRMTESQAEIVECDAPNGACCIAPACRLRGVLAEAIQAFYAVLDRYTLAELVANRRQLATILFADRAAETAA